MKFLFEKPPHTLSLELREDHGALVIHGVAQDAGPSADLDGLVGLRFPHERAIEAAVVALLRKRRTVAIDRVVLHDRAWTQWNQRLEDLAAQWHDRHLLVPGLPPQRARPDRHGNLDVWADVPGGGRVAIIVPPGEWDWAAEKRKMPSPTTWAFGDGG